MACVLDHRKYYRLPWTYSDNGVSWLEPTDACNLRCEGCYRNTDRPKHKSLDEVRDDLEVFKKLRISDCMSIAGGDPLVHPHIVDIVRMVKQMGWKPIVNTNGVALTREMLAELKKAGVSGFTFHIDSTQKRPDTQARTEAELNELRLYFARMLAEAGGISCSFNATVSQKTFDEIPMLVRWAQAYPDIVHAMVFILYRSPTLSGPFDFYAAGKKLNVEHTYKETVWGGAERLFAQDIVGKIREADPLYEPAAYLNGTANPNSFKWLLATRVVQGGRVLGYVTPRVMELAQTTNHVFRGRYLSYITPAECARARFWTTVTAIFDKGMRPIWRRMVKNMFVKPANWFRPARFQSFMIIQPIDIGADGRQDMCDGCPDITVYKGRLVWSCRLEELIEHGCFVSAAPKGKGIEHTKAPKQPDLQM